MRARVSDPRAKMYNTAADRGREIEWGLMRSAFVLNVDDERHFLTLPSFSVGFGSCERQTGRRLEIAPGTLGIRCDDAQARCQGIGRKTICSPLVLDESHSNATVLRR